MDPAPSPQPTRTEKDSLGELQVPANAYYGPQTQRAIQNFPISGTPMPRAFIHAHVLLKKAAATVNHDLAPAGKRTGPPRSPHRPAGWLPPATGPVPAWPGPSTGSPPR